MTQQDGVLERVCCRAAPCSFSKQASIQKQSEKKIWFQCEGLAFVMYRHLTYLPITYTK